MPRYGPSRCRRGNGLSQWVRKRAKIRGVEIEPRAAQSLTDMVGPELRVLDSEIQKLAAYGRDGTIANADVQALVSNTREASIFMAVDAVIEGRPGVALGHVGKLMQAGSSAGYVLAMLARQVRLLMLAKDLRRQGVAHDEMGSRLGVSGYPLRKTLEQGGCDRVRAPGGASPDACGDGPGYQVDCGKRRGGPGHAHSRGGGLSQQPRAATVARYGWMTVGRGHVESWSWS